MSQDLLQSLISLGVEPQPGPVGQQPIFQGENPMTRAGGFPPGGVPAATAAPDVAANPTRQVRSLEELLFGGTF
jgi:hypothetical protein